MDNKNMGSAAVAAPIDPVAEARPAITIDDIVRAQAETRAFEATRLGSLLAIYTRALGDAWCLECTPHESHKRLREAWAASNKAHGDLIAAIKETQGA